LHATYVTGEFGLEIIVGKNASCISGTGVVIFILEDFCDRATKGSVALTKKSAHNVNKNVSSSKRR